MRDNRQFFTEKRAVTPVIGAILIVATAVVLGAVVSSYALGATNGVGSPAPQAIFDFSPDYATGDIVVTKRGGNTLSGDQLKFSGAALEKNTYGSVTEWAGKDVEAGRSASVNVKPSETLRLIWQSPNGRTEAILAEYDVPSDVGPTASIGSINARADETSVEIQNIQFNRVSDRGVYIVVERNISGTLEENKSEFFTNGGDLTATGFTPTGGLRLRPITITVRVYETPSKLIEITTADCRSSRRNPICR